MTGTNHIMGTRGALAGQPSKLFCGGAEVQELREEGKGRPGC